MSEISIPYKIYKQIHNFITTTDVPEHAKITITQSTCGIGPSYEIKICKTHAKDIPGFETGIYATFTDYDNW